MGLGRSHGRVGVLVLVDWHMRELARIVFDVRQFCPDLPMNDDYVGQSSGYIVHLGSKDEPLRTPFCRPRTLSIGELQRVQFLKLQGKLQGEFRSTLR